MTVAVGVSVAAGSGVAVGGAGVTVGGSGVSVGAGVSVGGMDVAVGDGGTAAVGETAAEVGAGSGVAVGAHPTSNIRLIRISKPITRFLMGTSFSGLENQKVPLGNGIRAAFNSLKDFDKENVILIQVNELKIEGVRVDQGTAPF